MKLRFWIELGIGAVGLLALVATVVRATWIEAVFGVDPDHGSGVLEWAIVAIAASLAVAMFASARLSWLKGRAAAAPGAG